MAHGMDKYILDGHMAVPAELLEWAKWYENAGQSRVVAKTATGNGDVSTVFLGMDYRWGEGPPLIFETMIFGGTQDQYTDRCSTWEQAEAIHAKAVALASESIKGEQP